MNKVFKGMFTVLLVIYVISPLDLCPGPIDDVILVLVSLAANRGANAS